METLYVLLTPWYLYWYLVAPVALVAVLPRSRLTLPVLTFSGSTLVTARFAPWLLGQVVQTSLRYGPPIAVFLRHRHPSDERRDPRLPLPADRRTPSTARAAQGGRFVTLV